MKGPVYPHAVIASLWGHLEPMDRGEQYEDPLAEALEAQGLGRVTGGGSQLTESGEIAFADIELELANLDSALTLVRDTLESLGAPVGSELQFERNGAAATLPFGNQEGLGIYLDGLTLADEVYASCDINLLIERVQAALGASGAGQLRGCWQSQAESVLYVYGKNAEAAYRALLDILQTDPLCQNARLVFRSVPRANTPREIRMPRHS